MSYRVMEGRMVSYNAIEVSIRSHPYGIGSTSIRSIGIYLLEMLTESGTPSTIGLEKRYS